MTIRNADARLAKLEARADSLPDDPRIGIIMGPVDMNVNAFGHEGRKGDIIVTTTFEWDGAEPVIVTPVLPMSAMGAEVSDYLDRLTAAVVKLGDKQDIAGARTL